MPATQVPTKRQTFEARKYKQGLHLMKDRQQGKNQRTNVSYVVWLRLELLPELLLSRLVHVFPLPLPPPR